MIVVDSRSRATRSWDQSRAVHSATSRRGASLAQSPTSDVGRSTESRLRADDWMQPAVAVPGRLDDGVAGGRAGSVRVWIASGLRR